MYPFYTEEDFVKKLWLFLILLCALCFQSGLYGQKNPADLKYPDLDFSPPKAERVVLDNGMIVYLMEDDELPLFSGMAMRE